MKKFALVLAAAAAIFAAVPASAQNHMSHGDRGMHAGRMHHGDMHRGMKRMEHPRMHRERRMARPPMRHRHHRMH